jgi:transposase-like protein
MTNLEPRQKRVKALWQPLHFESPASSLGETWERPFGATGVSAGAAGPDAAADPRSRLARFIRASSGNRAEGWAESRHGHEWRVCARAVRVPVDAMTDLPDVSLTVAAVARRLGVAPATLRTWDRRYGLGPSEHSAGAHRRYSPDDVARLLTMRRLTLEGVAPGEAARTALVRDRGSTGPSEADVLDAYASVEVPADPAALVDAAEHGDNAAMRWLLARVHPRDVLEWYVALVRPALVSLAVGPVLERGGDSACHRLEASAYAELRSRSAAQAARSGQDVPANPSALVASLSAATDLEAHVLACALTSRDVPAAVLRGRGPDELADAITRVGPGALAVQVGRGDDSRAASLARLVAASSPDLTVFWHREGRDPVPDGLDVHRVRSLAGACHEVIAVLA